ncbi:MAG: Ribonuclease HII [Holosporales bacterium]
MPSFIIEDALRDYNTVIVGIDEVGCGPWAGPLVAACCYINKDAIPSSLLSLINDSKKISRKKREDIFLRIQDESHRSIWFGIGVIEIEEFNILGLKESLPYVIKKSIEKFPLTIDHVLVDGIRNPKLNIPTTMVIKGDQLSYSIAAASIIAKVTRDDMMIKLHASYPQYQWDQNAGYGTKAHQAAIKQFGLSPYHRTCYKPIQNFMNSYDVLNSSIE